MCQGALIPKTPATTALPSVLDREEQQSHLQPPLGNAPSTSRSFPRCCALARTLTDYCQTQLLCRVPRCGPFKPAPTANYLTSFFNTHTVPRNFGSRFRSLRRGESVEVFTLRSLRRAPNSASRHFKLAEPQSIPSVSVAEADMSRKVSSVQCCGLSLTFQSSPRAGGGLLGHHRLHPCPQRPHHHLRKAHSEGASSKD